MVNWTGVNVYDVDGANVGTLNDVVKGFPEVMRNAVVVDGKIVEWEYYFLGDDEEGAIPTNIDWSGFAEAYAAIPDCVK